MAGKRASELGKARKRPNEMAGKRARVAEGEEAAWRKGGKKGE
jgi:hypothetical protein